MVAQLHAGAASRRRLLAWALHLRGYRRYLRALRAHLHRGI
jgi:hypothetical protein